MGARVSAGGADLGYVLHAYPYRETSLILQLWTRRHGRFAAVAKGARRPRSASRAVLVPFQPLELSWFGRGEVKTLKAGEPAGPALPLAGPALLSAFYLNELLLRLLQRLDPHPELYAAYGRALAALPDATERGLRLFEKALLNELGYGLLLDHEAHGGAPVEPQAWYAYELESGPLRVEEHSPDRLLLAGSSLLSLAADELRDAQSLADAKRLMRAALSLYLGERELKTREVFAALTGR